MRFEGLGQIFLSHLRAHGGGALADLPARIVVGRPVRYVGARPDPALAPTRYAAMFKALGRPGNYVYETLGACFSVQPCLCWHARATTRLSRPSAARSTTSTSRLAPPTASPPV